MEDVTILPHLRLVGGQVHSPLQETAEGATSEKLQKTYKEAFEYLQRRLTEAALDSFKEADKQGGAHGLPCQKKKTALDRSRPVPIQ